MKYVNFLAIIPAIILIAILFNGFKTRALSADFAFAITEGVDLNNPELKVKPITTKISKELVAQTKNQKPCLVIYNQKVYEIPMELFEIHKGGSNQLTQACGNDITFIFNLMPHGQNAKKLLSQLYYAELKD